MRASIALCRGQAVYLRGQFWRVWSRSKKITNEGSPVSKGKWAHLFKAEAAKSDTYAESVTAISAKLMGDLALVASYTIRNNPDVPSLTEKTDTFTALSPEYVF